LYFYRKNETVHPYNFILKPEFQGIIPQAIINAGHFKKHRADIPEGRKGTNPGDLSKSEIIEIVYRYF
jgi:hypothetical protein